MLIHTKIVRRPEVLNLLQISQSALHDRIRKGIWPAPISLGARAVGWIYSENNQVLEAMIAGWSEEEIKQLVKSLMEQRKEKSKGILK